MAATKKKPPQHQVPTPAIPLTQEQALDHRAAAIRPLFERIFGYDGYGCHEWEINALVRAEAEADARAMAIVQDLITRRGFLEARALAAEPLDEDTDTRKPARKEADDDTIF